MGHDGEETLKSERKIVVGQCKEEEEREINHGIRDEHDTKATWRKPWFTVAVSPQSKVSPGIEVALVTHPDNKKPCLRHSIHPYGFSSQPCLPN